MDGVPEESLNHLQERGGLPCHAAVEIDTPKAETMATADKFVV